MTRFHDALNEQIAREFAASQQYVAIAVHYDARDAARARGPLLPPGARGAEPRDDDRPVPARRRTPGSSCRVSRRRRRRVRRLARARRAGARPGDVRSRSQIVELARLARDEGDLVGEQFLHWFLQEQREEVASMSALLVGRRASGRQPPPRRGVPRATRRPATRPRSRRRRRRRRAERSRCKTQGRCS